jgi:hypothetical protein
MLNTLEKEIQKTFPPSLVNNSREYVRKLIDRFNQHPSQSLANKIEFITGFPADFDEGDYGNGARGESFKS